MMNRSKSRARSPPDFGNFNSYIEKRDYVGALATIDFGDVELSPVDKLFWIVYCSTRLGGRRNNNRAKEALLELLSEKFQDEDVPQIARLFLSIVYFQLGRYTDAEETALSVTQDSELKTRILLHVAQKTKDETKLAKYRQQLSDDSKEGKLSAAAVEFSFRHRYQEAVDVYKNILAGNVDDLALYVYSAMSLFKMGCYDQSLEALAIYCQAHPDSTIAANLKACNMFHLYNGKTALETLDAHCDSKTKDEHDLVRHNTVVFNDGEKALQVLPGLVDRVPEAKLNLAIYYLKHGEIEAAAELMGDDDTGDWKSHLVLGILNSELGRVKGDTNALAKAKHHFQSMGQSSTECDTIPGRQCMASYFYLMNQFDDVNFYLESIKAYSEYNDDFNWNYGCSLCASGKYKDGLAFLLKVSKETYKTELEYVLWLVKCYIMTNNPEEAWECYLQTEDSHISYEILQLIGNECYKANETASGASGMHFLCSARSFSALLKIDPFPDYINGFLGASVGYFRHVILTKSNKESSDGLKEILDMLTFTTLPKAQTIAAAIQTWAIRNQG